MSGPQPGPYYSTWGPKDGPIRYKDNPPAMGVVSDPAGGFPIGIAYPGRNRPDPRGSVVLFRLVVGGHELPGRWECRRREFVPVGEGGAGDQASGA
jgi:hypothetical protein